MKRPYHMIKRKCEVNIVDQLSFDNDSPKDGCQFLPISLMYDRQLSSVSSSVGK